MLWSLFPFKQPQQSECPILRAFCESGSPSALLVGQEVGCKTFPSYEPLLLWLSSPEEPVMSEVEWGICFYLLVLQLFFAFSAQKSHVKSQNHLTPSNKRK